MNPMATIYRSEIGISFGLEMPLLQIACANNPVWIAWPARNEILRKTWTHNNIGAGWEFGTISNMIPMPMTPDN